MQTRYECKSNKDNYTHAHFMKQGQLYPCTVHETRTIIPLHSS